eukprot:scaffold19441_cov129-Isochrysis_galbana.AAC.1
MPLAGGLRSSTRTCSYPEVPFSSSGFSSKMPARALRTSFKYWPMVSILDGETPASVTACTGAAVAANARAAEAALVTAARRDSTAGRSFHGLAGPDKLRHETATQTRCDISENGSAFT